MVGLKTTFQRFGRDKAGPRFLVFFGWSWEGLAVFERRKGFVGSPLLDSPGGLRGRIYCVYLGPNITRFNLMIMQYSTSALSYEVRVSPQRSWLARIDP